jgi:hypothetical protein
MPLKRYNYNETNNFNWTLATNMVDVWLYDLTKQSN